MLTASKTHNFFFYNRDKLLIQPNCKFIGDHRLVWRGTKLDRKTNVSALIPGNHFLEATAGRQRRTNIAGKTIMQKAKYVKKSRLPHAILSYKNSHLGDVFNKDIVKNAKILNAQGFYLHEGHLLCPAFWFPDHIHYTRLYRFHSPRHKSFIS